MDNTENAVSDVHCVFVFGRDLQPGRELGHENKKARLREPIYDWCPEEAPIAA